MSKAEASPKERSYRLRGTGAIGDAIVRVERSLRILLGPDGEIISKPHSFHGSVRWGTIEHERCLVMNGHRIWLHGHQSFALEMDRVRTLEGTFLGSFWKRRLGVFSKRVFWHIAGSQRESIVISIREAYEPRRNTIDIVEVLESLGFSVASTED